MYVEGKVGGLRGHQIVSPTYCTMADIFSCNFPIRGLTSFNTGDYIEFVSFSLRIQTLNFDDWLSRSDERVLCNFVGNVGTLHIYCVTEPS